MEFSFRIKIALEFGLIVFGVLAVVYSYLGVIIGVIGCVLLYCEVRNQEAEKTDFRKKIIQEALDKLDFVLDPNTLHISHANWDSKAEESKRDLLGHKEYDLWKKFYDSIDARNQHIRDHGLAWNGFEKVNDQCVRSLLRIKDEISWVKECEKAKTRIAAFKEKARETASISESLRSELM